MTEPAPTRDAAPARALRQRADRGIEPASLRRAAYRLVGLPLLTVVPALLLIVVVVQQQRSGLLAFDFRGTIWEPGSAILHGRNPYPAADADALGHGNPAIYPPLAMVVLAPLGALPWPLASAIWGAFLAGSVLAGLWLVGVRDWRCGVLALVSFPVVVGLALGNITLLLVAGLALAWRFRDRVVVSALLVAVLVALKLLLWPLVVWLLATQRFRAALLSIALTGALLLVPWAVIGFDGLAHYRALLSAASDVYATHGISLVALATGLGASGAVADVAPFVAGAVGLLAVGMIARRADGERRSFTVAVVTAVLASPIAWSYYLALLLIPLALRRRELSWPWFVLPATWLVTLFLPREDVELGTCCRPATVPALVWETLHSPPWTLQIAGFLVFAGLLTMYTLRAPRRVAP